MKSVAIRILVAVTTFVLGLFTSSFSHISTLRQTDVADRQLEQTCLRNNRFEILDALLRSGQWADESQLSRFDRNKEIEILNAVQGSATGARANSIAFLLAILESDYSANRDLLVKRFNGEGGEINPKFTGTSVQVAEYLMRLCERGDWSLLGTLFQASEKSDDNVSERLGDYYFDFLNINPDQFLLALSLNSKDQQKRICGLAVASQANREHNRLWSVNEGLKSRVNDPDYKFQSAATTCRLGLRIGFLSILEHEECLGLCEKWPDGK